MDPQGLAGRSSATMPRYAAWRRQGEAACLGDDKENRDVKADCGHQVLTGSSAKGTGPAARGPRGELGVISCGGGNAKHGVVREHSREAVQGCLHIFLVPSNID